ncbi:MAG: 2-oxoacid:acceptor oxidoreductase subunit alpha, partial [Candidatus Bathyarchaeia archaeon]
QDVYQARYGAHGDYEAIALSPWSVQEMFDLTVRAFNLAERFRVPVLLMADGAIAHIKERLVVPEKVEIMERRRPKGPDCTPFGTDDPLGVPEMPLLGEGYRLLITGSSHRPTGRRDDSPRYMQMKVERINEKIRRARREITDTVPLQLEDAELAVVSYGASARPSCSAVLRARSMGIRVGLLRLRTLWPFPDEEVSALSEMVRAILVVEMNMGKMVREVERAAKGRARVAPLPKVGGVLPTSDEILEGIRRLQR